MSKSINMIMTPKERLLRQQLIDVGRSFFLRGYATGTSGNMSVLLDNQTILATPTGSCLGDLQLDDLAKVTLFGEQISGEKPSKELAFHLSLYHHNPSCRAVVHLHSTYVTALSCLEDLDPENVIKPFTPYLTMRAGRIPLIPYYQPGDRQLADELAKRAATYNAFVLANHGAVVSGNDLVAAVNIVEELEENAKLFFVLKNNKIRYLTDSEVNELR